MLSTISNYLFIIRPPAFAALGMAFIVSSIAALILTAIIVVGKNKIPLFYRSIARKIKTLLLWYGTISMMLIFVRIERVPYLSMRIWLWIWCLIILVFGIFILIREYKKIPARKKRYFNELKQKRYFNT